jgi:hypothetical protein
VLSHDIGKRMALKRVAEFEIGIEDGVSLVPAKLLQPGGMDATIHAGGHGAALEAVAAEDSRIKARGLGPQFDDPRDGAGIDGVFSDQRPEAWRVRRERPGEWQPDQPEDRPLCDARGLLPASERPHWTESGRAIGARLHDNPNYQANVRRYVLTTP